MANDIKKWSYSQYASYKTCPKQTEFKYVLKVPEAPRAASTRGTEIHQLCEDFLKGDDTKLVQLPEIWHPLLKKLKAKKATPEMALALNSDWSPGSWFDRNAWVRAKLDAGVFKVKTAYLVDYKTGRIYPEDHAMQLELYALISLRAYPKLDRVTTALWYLDLTPAEISEMEMTREEAEHVQVLWMHRISDMFTATKFPARPGRHCSWCGYSSKKGGPCDKG